MAAPTTLRYVSAFDGLRAIAVLLVFVFHVPGTAFYLPSGSIGVDIFFVLSGFLITSLLVEERRTFGRIDLSKFYMRRVLRLFPALLITVAAVVLIAFTKSGELRNDILLDAAAAGTYTSNWVHAFEGLPVLYLQHSWSLAAEEQYYLFWAIAVVALIGRHLKPERIVIVGLGLAALSIVWRLVLLTVFDASYERVYFGLDTRLDGLLLGSAVGAMRYTPMWDRLRTLWTNRLAIPGAAALLALMIVGTRVSSPGNIATFGLMLPLVAVATALITIVLVETKGSPLHTGLSWAPLVRLGRLSYGFYLFHIPVVRLLREEAELSGELLFFVALVVTYALAELSHRFVEAPALSYKDRFRPKKQASIPEVVH